MVSQDDSPFKKAECIQPSIRVNKIRGPLAGKDVIANTSFMFFFERKVGACIDSHQYLIIGHFTVIENFTLKSFFKVNIWNLTLDFFHTPLKRAIGQFTNFQFTLIEGWFTNKSDSSFGRLIHSSRRVNGDSQDTLYPKVFLRLKIYNQTTKKWSLEASRTTR
jgi:hypothetical protein